MTVLKTKWWPTVLGQSRSVHSSKRKVLRQLQKEPQSADQGGAGDDWLREGSAGCGSGSDGLRSMRDCKHSRQLRVGPEVNGRGGRRLCGATEAPGPCTHVGKQLDRQRLGCELGGTRCRSPPIGGPNFCFFCKRFPTATGTTRSNQLEEIAYTPDPTPKRASHSRKPEQEAMAAHVNGQNDGSRRMPDCRVRSPVARGG